MILILGGTAEARELALALGNKAILSLKGATRTPQAAPQRVGGFGGVAGLQQYLLGHRITRIIDATHPFAARISANIAAAAGDIPVLRLTRAAWPLDNRWQSVNSLTNAAQALPDGARVFLSIGRQSLGPFLNRDTLWCLTRCIEPPGHLPQPGALVLQRPPFSLPSELALMAHHKISHLVSKNAGGGATKAKLEAAAQLGVQVIMVKRPRLPKALTVETVAEAVKWVENQGD